MNLKLKYPQRFKKQHKSRVSYQPVKASYLGNLITPNKPSSSKFALASSQDVTLPNKFITFLRKILRKFFKKRNIRCWFRVQPNHLISSKGKNSRMGKGTGSINRIAFRVKANKPILVIDNISPSRVLFLLRNVQARSPVPLKYYKVT